jgi:ABC-type phosphate transport system substrate-binding protein
MQIQSRFRRAAAGLALAMAAVAARADVVVVVSSRNPCGQLTAAQVSDIFLGNAASFPGGGQAVPVDQGDGAVREEFYGKAVGKSSAQVKAYWSKIIFTGKGRPPKEAGDSLAVRKLVADSPGLIGYIERSAVDASVKVVLAVH